MPKPRAIRARLERRAAGDFDVESLIRYAKICRVASVVHPYLEATL